ncbi:prolyl oligopeptidase family serine peptidase [Undibacterium sp. FT79W]|uniref:alpha/beta hydrolase family protein n=1 Tax=Undibacterium sp. FT79W TaxID=2762296 RepID=UPI00164A9A5D|nr:prolyl oligopeptidase family serine peptidase [Undibacterium sp. FT79W]MBC3876617.1 prolyl oligopeptidase family serine peptidase [Undibacterium sp. FT79W]
MFPKFIPLSIALACSGAALLPQQIAHAAPASNVIAKVTPAELTLEQVFRAKPYAGQSAKVISFSHDGRYLAYVWNPFNEIGSDLYVHDTQTGETRRITSPALMKTFDAPEVWDRFEKKAKQKEKEETERQAKAEAHAAYLRGEKVNLQQWEEAGLEEVKRELADKKARDAKKKAEADAESAKEKAAEKAAAKTSGTTDTAVAKADEKKDSKADKDSDKQKELWELRDELKKKIAKEKLKPSDLYPGVDYLAWANKKNELIFQYRGDLFRLQAASGKVERLTQTDKAERIVAYRADDKGYIYMDSKSLYSAAFDNSAIRQLNRELIHPDDAEKKYSIANTVLSEDKQWMAISAVAPDVDEETGKVKPSSERQVEIMNYNERFATAKKVPREVSDDKRKIPATALYIRRVADTSVRQPQPVFTNNGGDVWFEMSKVNWAKDGSRYTFSTWEREKNLLRIYVGKAEEGVKPALVFERRGNVGHEVVNVLEPKFTPDGKQLIAVLDEQGYRQPYIISTDNSNGSGSAKAILKGDFEAHQIIGFTPDSKSMFVLANKDDFASMNAYKVDIASGEMKALGQPGDFHRASDVADTGDKLASVAGQWSNRPELKLIDVKTSKITPLTQSHDPQWQAIDVQQPERFSFKNRHGDQIQAYVFKPANWKTSDLRPAIVYTYGGPLNDRHIIETDSFQQTAYMFGMYMSAKNGYVTVAVDPRGHSNYGRKFSDANWEQAGKPQTEDLEDLAQYMQKNLGVDGHRIGLTGWSFGGFQTQYTMYTSPDTFAAGIAGAGPTEWENYNSWYSGRTIGKTERSKPNLRKYSLLPLTAGLKKPLLLVHGMQDPNVLYQDTVNVYRALLENGKETLVDLFLDPDGEHALGGAIKAKAWHKKYEAFFLQHLGSGNK